MQKIFENWRKAINEQSSRVLPGTGAQGTSGIEDILQTSIDDEMPAAAKSAPLAKQKTKPVRYRRLTAAPSTDFVEKMTNNVVMQMKSKPEFADMSDEDMYKEARQEVLAYLDSLQQKAAYTFPPP